MHDGEQDLGGLRLRGVAATADVGLLTLQEAYGYVRVGAHLKAPRRAVWVVYSESHYSLLVAAPGASAAAALRLRAGDGGADGGSGEAAPPPAGGVDVYYWDGLGDQREPIRLTVRENVDGVALPDPNDDAALIPPLDLVLRTKWAGCLVDWNGSEPIL